MPSFCVLSPFGELLMMNSQLPAKWTNHEKSFEIPRNTYLVSFFRFFSLLQVVPFHIKYSNDGKVIIDSKSILFKVKLTKRLLFQK